MRDLDRRAAEAAHNLPSRLSSFVGREREIVEIVTLLGARRLVTLVGAPGVGKTRLSLQVASAELKTFPDGIWLVELAPLADPALVPQAVADVLGVREQPGRELTAVLADWLRSRQLLLLLDNCEHLVGAAAALTDALLQACPRLHVLATSREPLAIDGEIVRRVASLTVPDARDLETLNMGSVAPLMNSDAVRLFVERARAADATFALTGRNASTVAQICARLDGIPLALELAAARVRALTVEQIAARLDDRFHLLTGGSRAVLPRQQTLRSAVDWSYALLSEPEQALLRRLAVFAGGFTLDAAERIGRDQGGVGSEPPQADLLDLLTGLVDKSLIQVEPGDDGQRRFRLLETLRQYGHEKLVAHGEVALARDRHRDYFLAFAEAVAPGLERSEVLTRLTQLDREQDDLRAALAWCLEATGEHDELDRGANEPATTASEIGSRFAAALVRFWWLRGHLDEGRRWLSLVLALPVQSAKTATERSARVRALLGAANLAAYQGDVGTAVAYSETALALSRAADDDRGESQALHRLGAYRAVLGDHNLARRLCEESVEIARCTGDPRTLAMALMGSAHTARTLEEYERCVSFCQEALALLRELDDIVVVTYVLRWMGSAVYGLGDRSRALALVEEALHLSRDIGDRRGLGESYYALGQFALVDGDVVAALTLLRSAISSFRECGDRTLSMWSFFRLAGVRTLQGSRAMNCPVGDQPLHPSARECFLEAARLLAAVDMLLRVFGLGPNVQMKPGYDRALPVLRQHLGDSLFERAWTEGQAMTFEQVVVYALTITQDEVPTVSAQDSETAPLAPDPELARLTRREREIASLAARGLANPQIAAELTVTRRTVETHVHNILGKLELTTRGQLAFWAFEHGLLSSTGRELQRAAQTDPA